MPRETLEAKRARTLEVIARLRDAYPDASISLEYGNDFQLLVAVMLSAQCTDAMVNKVTRTLFKKYRTVDDFARADLKTLQREIRSTGFFRNKSRAVIAAAKAVRDRFGGRVPSTMEELDSIPGVARKTANVVLWNAFRKTEGIAVDTHVTRIANLLRLTRRKDPVRIEQDLLRLVPRHEWGVFTHHIIDHGRAVCIARRPRCEACVLNDVCPSAARPADPALLPQALATPKPTT
ncbi:MAG: endonuclease III [Euryarchaeota archaeon]|nr:endonuclease III [Euryarchaeota archaeon]